MMHANTSGESAQETAIEVVLSALTISPGMGGRSEMVWDVYRPEGVAITIVHALEKAGLL